MPHHNMEDDIVVLDIGMVFVAIPITGSNVNLYIAFHEARFADNNCIPEVRAAIAVASAGVDYIELLILRGSQLCPRRLLPY
jgi:hypothetical protein